MHVAAGNDLLEGGLALEQRDFPQVAAVEVEQIECDEDDPARITAQLLDEYRIVGGPVRSRYHDLAVDDRRARLDVPDVLGNFLEALGPVVAAPGKDGDGFVGEMHLNAIAVEFDLMDPALTRWHAIDRRCERRLDETKEGRLHAERFRSSPGYHGYTSRRLNCHRYCGA